MNQLTRALTYYFGVGHGAQPSLSEKQWESLILVARECGLLGRLYHVLQEKQLLEHTPDFAQRHLNAARLYAERQAQQVRYEAKLLCELSASAAQQHYMFLKGAAYVLADSPVAAGRTFSDIDFLVRKQNLDKVEQTLKVFGWFQDQTSDYDQRYYRQWTHEIPPLRHNVRGTVLDLHHNLIPPVSGRAPDMALFWQRVVKLKSGAKVLSPAAMTLHSLVHLFFGEDFSNGFRDLSDLHLLFTHHAKEQDFWPEILDLAITSRFERELFLACRYCQKVFATAIPEDIGQELAAFAPSKHKLKLLDWMFLQVLMPQHPKVGNQTLSLAKGMALIRGHWLKMPLHILLLHTVSKTFLGLFFLLSGSKKLNRPQNEQANQ